jgi:cell wall-associated NlpC family hydrolase
MPHRLVIFLLACVCVAVAFASGAQADKISAVRGFRLESPARFVPPPRPPKLTLSQRAVRLARRQLGVPYSYGGASPSGFDCSGLVSWVYGRLGLSLPHNAAALYTIGRPVPRGKLRPGDLVFFSGLGHVGLYIGRGRMIHSPQSGETVEIQALGSRSSPPVGARRIV